MRPAGARPRPRLLARLRGRPGARPRVVAATPRPGLATLVAELTRAAHQTPGLVGGLPEPDGAHDTPAGVRADLRDGGQVWLAYADRHTVAGMARVRRDSPAQWMIHRVSVLPAWRRHGVARALVRGIEAAAAAAGVAEVVLDAVVERRLAAFYAGLGYRVVSHWPSPDKLLSEVTMRRSPADPPCRYDRPGTGDDAPPGNGVAVCWWAVPGGVSVRVSGPVPDPVGLAGTQPGPPGGLLIGVDIWPDGPATAVTWLRERLRDDLAASVPADPASCPGYRQPRLLDPRLLAWWRPLTVPGQE